MRNIWIIDAIVENGIKWFEWREWAESGQTRKSHTKATFVFVCFAWDPALTIDIETRIELMVCIHSLIDSRFHIENSFNYL